MGGRGFHTFASSSVSSSLLPLLRRPSFCNARAAVRCRRESFFLISCVHASPRPSDYSPQTRPFRCSATNAVAAGVGARRIVTRPAPASTTLRPRLQSPRPAYSAFAGFFFHRTPTHGIPSSRGCSGWSPTPVALAIPPYPTPPPPPPSASFYVDPGCWFQEVSVLLPDEAELDRASEDEGGAEISPGVTLRTLRNSG